MIRLAVLADIHGNLPALEAVVDDLQRETPDLVYLAGDQVNRCPWNNEVLDLIADRGWPCIAGNHDLVVGIINTAQNRPPFTQREHFPTLWWTQESLRAEHLVTIRGWPEERRLDFAGLPALRLFHGVPGNSFVGILPEDSDEKIAKFLADVAEPIVICAHIHRPLHRVLPHHTVYNGGSVGIPYNGDPRAQYLLLDGNTSGWQPTWRRVSYDQSGIPLAFEQSGMRAASGPVSELHLRTVLQGEPWISDFGHWLRLQGDNPRDDMATAVATYLHHHGPGRWAFTVI
ncbi:MAG: metallophosphoesterase [Caldilineaceae bacterium]